MNRGKQCSPMLKPRFEQCATADPRAFRRSLAEWFARHGRDDPWRRTSDPYAILVSEVMLQQTQVATVLGKGYYQRFLTSFPDLAALAAADDATLLKAWEGLGYYRRARMLRETARAVISRHAGVFPQETTELLKLPGIGPYTAGALRAFAFGLPAVLVDGNVNRVLARLMDFRQPVDETSGRKRIHAWAAALADERNPRVHHAALMELGQRLCRPGVPDCHACPVARHCRTRRPETLPLKARKTAVSAVDEHAIWLRDAAGRLLLHREVGPRRTGLWKLPLREAAAVGHLPVLAEQSYAITRYRVRLRVHDGGTAPARWPLEDGDAWIAPDDIPDLAMAAPFRKAVEKLIAGGR
jgi:A/G-specific adenine glycosylase